MNYYAQFFMKDSQEILGSTGITACDGRLSLPHAIAKVRNDAISLNTTWYHGTKTVCYFSLTKVNTLSELFNQIKSLKKYNVYKED